MEVSETNVQARMESEAARRQAIATFMSVHGVTHASFTDLCQSFIGEPDLTDKERHAVSFLPFNLVSGNIRQLGPCCETMVKLFERKGRKAAGYIFTNLREVITDAGTHTKRLYDEDED